MIAKVATRHSYCFLLSTPSIFTLLATELPIELTMRTSTFLAAAAAVATSTTHAQLAGSEDGPNNSTESGGTPTAQDGNRTIHYVDVAKGGHFYQVCI